jgi:uncharacterized protein
MPRCVFVDADACPVKDEAARVAIRHGVAITFVSNNGLKPIHGPNVEHVVVSSGFDAADDWIVERVAAGDVVITSDIPLAARCLEKRARVLNASGRETTADTIGEALTMRELTAYLREAGDIRGHNPSFTKRDRSEFLQALDRILNQLKRVT